MEALTRAWDGTPREQAFVWELRKERRVARCGLWWRPLRSELNAQKWVRASTIEVVA
jgi:hypothetical protein